MLRYVFTMEVDVQNMYFLLDFLVCIYTYVNLGFFLWQFCFWIFFKYNRYHENWESIFRRETTIYTIVENPMWNSCVYEDW